MASEAVEGSAAAAREEAFDRDEVGAGKVHIPGERALIMNPVRTAESFAEEIAQALGDEPRSVLLYGSVPRGEAVEGVSDINILILLEEIELAVLGRASELAGRWVEAGNTAPLILAWRDWRRAADVFPVELSDMKSHHRMLRGADPLEGLEVRRSALRLQAERELRAKLIQLHEGLLLAGPDPKGVGDLLLTALPSFTTFMRAVLRLEGIAVPDSTEEVIAAAGRVVGGDPHSMVRAWRARMAGDSVEATLEGPIVKGYYELVEKTVAHVDMLTEQNR